MKKDELVGSQRGDRSTWARALAVLGVCFVVACSQSVPAESGGEAGVIEEALPMTEWQRALFPPQNTAKLAVQIWGRHRALTHRESALRSGRSLFQTDRTLVIDGR